MIGSSPFFKRIVAEDVGERGGDDGAEAETGQRPGRMFAARAAAEVVTRQEDLCALRLWLVEDEIGLGDPSAL